ncbi:unnamed protein product [Camellia sinensis]
MLTAVLWLGNVSFTVIDNENHVEPVADEDCFCMGYCGYLFLCMKSICSVNGRHLFLNNPLY